MVNIDFFLEKFPKGVSPLCAGVVPRSKVSRKVATREGRIEVSETTLFELTHRTKRSGLMNTFKNKHS